MSKQETLHGQLFYDQHQETIGEVFEVLQLPSKLIEDFEQTVAVTQDWVKGDHARPVATFDDLSDKASARLQPLYTKLDLVEERPLEPGSYDYCVVPGAVQRGNNRRLKHVKAGLRARAVIKELVLLGGERRVYPETEIEAIQDDMSELRHRKPADQWVADVRDGYEWITWESDLVRLAATRQLGPLAPVATSLERISEVDLRPRTQWFTQGTLLITLLHSPAVEREQGEPRHTTESCLTDWITNHEPTQGATMAFIATNPHIDRMNKVARRVLRDTGREDITVVTAGPGAIGAFKNSLYLGEIARNLYEDQLALNA